MDTPRRRFWRVRWLVLLLVAGVLAIPAAQAQDSTVLPNGMVKQLSQGALIPYLKEHPKQAPARLAEQLRGLDKVAGEGQRSFSASQTALPPPPGVGERFNRDNFGLPQNEESITACRSQENVVLGGTNDYRGLIDEQQNFTGWHFSTDGGASLRNEGLLPPVRIKGQAVPSGGDPVMVADSDCNLYAGSLNFDPVTFDPNGIGVYRTTPERLVSCSGGNSPSCWPNRRVVAVGAPGHFLDKPWIYAGKSGSAGTVVWVVYSDFHFTGPGELDFTASIKAVRCSADLSNCTDPIRISGDDRDVQDGDVTIGPDGRVYITWSEIQGELEGTPQTFTPKLRVAQAGSTHFGPTRTVAVENDAIPFGGFLNANDFRVSTYPKNEVRMVNGKPRIYVVWDACRERIFSGTVCERPEIKLKKSDDFGASWSKAKIISSDGANYFPTISNDREGRELAIAYYTSRFDPRFDNRQDVELLSLNPKTLDVVSRQRLTSLSNESESDPVLGGFFIGDYIEVFANDGKVLTHYNANYRQIRVLGDGLSVPQQDNYLVRRTTP